MKHRFTDRQIKWLILLIPTITVGVWEYARHAFLLPYLSMELGNWLTPVIVLAVTLTLVRHLFARLEHSHEALQRERLVSASLEEREQLARELHDGIAQSLFLLAVKLDKLDRTPARNEPQVQALTGELKETVRLVHDDVRQAIAGLRKPPLMMDAAWLLPLHEVIEQTASVTEAEAEFRWDIPDTALTGKEKVELHAILREALMNVRKHAQAAHVRVIGETIVNGQAGFRCAIEDDGIGFDPEQASLPGRFGMRVMRDRAARIGWSFTAERRGQWTVIEMIKKNEGGAG